jgi:hypothetical protein
MSLCHGTALKEIGGEDATDCAAWQCIAGWVVKGFKNHMMDGL